MTARTIIDREILERELIKIRRMGYAIDDREIMDSLRCIAAPIYDRDGKVEYAISVSCLPGSLQGERFDMIRDELLRIAESISYMMGYRKTDS
jgi:DNA-binding IclR family transcriptional regulator